MVRRGDSDPLAVLSALRRPGDPGAVSTHDEEKCHVHDQKRRSEGQENPAGDPDQKYIYEKGMHLGEWLEPEEFQEKISAGNMPEHPEEWHRPTLHYTLGIMAQISTFWERKMTRLSLPSIPRGKAGVSETVLRVGGPGYGPSGEAGAASGPGTV